LPSRSAEKIELNPIVDPDQVAHNGELMEAVAETAPGSKPIIRYRVTVMSDAGRLVLWLSESAAKNGGAMASVGSCGILM
jgi:hypothetical protein